jgi:7,8-dihydropterin-6-yl-methyl-4-(beta-D-ribofuranosyl)aminobenzene 5'-phosphate synthase
MAGIIVLVAAISASEASAQSSTGQITVLYDAFGKTSTMTKDWGFAALVEYGGKRILSTLATTRRSSHTMSKPRVSI